MSSQSSSTQPQAPAPPPRSAINPLTLLLAAVSSAAAAFIVSKVWEGGTLIATAMTPVLVALVREALEKPAAAVTTLGAPLAPSRVRGRATGPRGEAEPTLVQSPDPAATHAPRTTYRSGGRVSRRWVRVGLVTGLLAFVIAAVVYTGTELVSGSSSAGGQRATSIFGGDRSASRDDVTPASTTTTSTSESATTETVPEDEATATVTTPAETPTVTVTTPVPEATTPAETAPVPEATTPAPDATATTPGAGAAEGAAP